MARILHGVEAPPRASDHLLPTMTLYEMRATRIGLTVHPSSRLPDRASGLYPLELGDAFELFEQFGSGLITIFGALGALPLSGPAMTRRRLDIETSTSLRMTVVFSASLCALCGWFFFTRPQRTRRCA